MAVEKSVAPPTVCALVLNYNGKEHLEECLASLLRAARAYEATREWKLPVVVKTAR